MSAVVTLTARPLPTLANRIHAEVDAAERDWQSALAHAIRAGELLLAAKAQCRHGTWLPWLEANFEFAPQTAQGYMRLAKARTPLHLEEGLSIDAALKLLARPRSHNEPDARPAWSLPGAMPDVLPAADAEVAAALLGRVREAKEALERAVTGFEDAHGAYREYARTHKPGPPMMPVAVEASWEKQSHGAFYGRRAA